MVDVVFESAAFQRAVHLLSIQPDFAAGNLFTHGLRGGVGWIGFERRNCFCSARLLRCIPLPCPKSHPGNPAGDAGTQGSVRARRGLHLEPRQKEPTVITFLPARSFPNRLNCARKPTSRIQKSLPLSDLATASALLRSVAMSSDVRGNWVTKAPSASKIQISFVPTSSARKGLRKFIANTNRH